ncbi:MAG TPA: hypothetical protein VIK33_15710 [Anaerolineae bacterium]
MRRQPLSRLGAILAAVVLLLAAALPALAHEEIEVGPYILEVGWVDEPPLIGVKNAVFVSIAKQDGGDPVEGVSTLEVTVSTGDKDLQLELRPLGEDRAGQYAADFIPTRRGVYAVKLSGTIEDTDVNVSVEIEEVAEATGLQFPEALPDALALNRAVEEATAAAGNAQTLAVVGIVAGAIGALLGVIGLVRRK